MSLLNQAAARVTPECMVSAARPFCWRYWLIRPRRACSSLSTAWSAEDTGQADDT